MRFFYFGGKLSADINTQCAAAVGGDTLFQTQGPDRDLESDWFAN